MKGKVYLVGAGPGNVGLLTCRGRELLEQCQVVVYDRLASNQLLDLVPNECKKIDVGKRVGNHPYLQSEINEILVQEAKNGYFVVRLKGGDPFVFGRGGEEIQRLMEEQIPYEVIPGITSAIAVPEWAGIPVTHRGISQSFHVITGHTADDHEGMAEDIEKLAKLNGTLIFLMGIGNLKKIIGELIIGGMDESTEVAIIENGTLPNQRITKGNLQSIVKMAKERKVEAPAILLVGNVAALNFEGDRDKPKKSARVGVVGTNHMFSKMKQCMEKIGGEVIQIGTTQILSKECPKWDLFCKEIQTKEQSELQGKRWIAFTSSNGVELFFSRLKEEKIDHRVLANVQFAVIGEGTGNKLQEYGYNADFMPSEYCGECFGEELSKIIHPEDCVYLPRAIGGSSELIQKLLERTARIVDMGIYDLSLDIDSADSRSKIKECDYLAFFNGSTVHEFMEQLEDKSTLEQLKVVALGLKTAQALEKWGITGQIISKDCQVDDLCMKIREDYK